MTAKRFTYYLKNPSHLYQISYQELKSLVVQYPYCQNLRYLLVTKSQIDNSNEYQKDLQLAATYSVDRRYLYKLVNQEVNTTSDADSFVLNNDYLELKDISDTTVENNTNSSTPIILGSVAGVTAGLAADNIEAPSATKNNDYVPVERRIKRIKRVSLNEASEMEKINEKIAVPRDIIEQSVEEVAPEVVEETHLEYIQDATAETLEEKEIIEDIKPLDEDHEDIAENISDEPEMIAYMEKPKKRKSVIDQLLGRPAVPSNVEPKDDVPNIEDEMDSIIYAEDELESPEVQDNAFMDLTPVKDTQTYGREVLFEITNKTDQEMDALLQKNKTVEDEFSLDQNITSMSPTPDKDIPTPKDDEPSVPSPKSSFKSYLDQFQPPANIVDGIEDEQEIENVLQETIEEANEETQIMEVVDKKNKKRKEKKEKSKKEKVKAKKGKKSKNKKKEKSLVKKVAKQSIQESDDIFSETLAELLASQGSRKKAIQMYKRLSLIFPKKSSFFAEKIRKLKK